MEVAEDTYESRDLGRVVWTIEYEQTGRQTESYLAGDSKIVSQINIHSKDRQRLVPILKVKVILWLVVIKIVFYPMWNIFVNVINQLVIGLIQISK